jgi:hypothetical protein
MNARNGSATEPKRTVFLRGGGGSAVAGRLWLEQNPDGARAVHDFRLMDGAPDQFPWSPGIHNIRLGVANRSTRAVALSDLRHADRIVLSFDGDRDTGRCAAIRADLRSVNPRAELCLVTKYPGTRHVGTRDFNKCCEAFGLDWSKERFGERNRTACARRIVRSAAVAVGIRTMPTGLEDIRTRIGIEYCHAFASLLRGTGRVEFLDHPDRKAGVPAIADAGRVNDLTAWAFAQLFVTSFSPDRAGHGAFAVRKDKTLSLTDEGKRFARGLSPRLADIGLFARISSFSIADGRAEPSDDDGLVEGLSEAIEAQEEHVAALRPQPHLCEESQ